MTNRDYQARVIRARSICTIFQFHNIDWQLIVLASYVYTQHLISQYKR